ncbi:MAG TPA: RICIN domain-containing protein [Bryobacteraceae bacterium]
MQSFASLSSHFVIHLAALMLGIGSQLSRAQVNVLTHHNDNFRTGQNLAERILTPSIVNSSTFGKLFEVPMDGKVDGQPLYVTGLRIPGRGIHNVAFAATEHDSVYAFDADTGSVYWHVSLLGSGETTSDPRGCSQVWPEIGITSTPVISLKAGAHGTIYLVAMSKDAVGKYHQRLHALDLTTGTEEFGGPVDIKATYPGYGDNSSNGTVFFDPKQYKERAALLLDRGILYTSWGSHCDFRPYTGWLIAYDPLTLAQTGIFNFAPNGNDAALWGSGAGLAADGVGYLFFSVANGTFDTTLNIAGFPNKGDYGNSLLRISTVDGNLIPDSYWTMYNTVAESNADEDLGSGGILLLPRLIDATDQERDLAVSAGKDRNIYVVDRRKLGGFNPNNNSNIYQVLPLALAGPEFGAPAWFNGKVYFGAVNDTIRSYAVNGALVSPAPVSRTTHVFGFPGATPSISANGKNGGILWAIENSSPAVLHAYDASNLATQFYNSKQAANGRDHFGPGNKFMTPTIANGKVYVGTPQSVAVFGVLDASRRPVEIIARNSGKCLDVRNISTLQGAGVQQWTCWNGPNQQWKLTPAGDGSFIVRSINSGMVLDVYGAFTNNGDKIQQWSSLGQANQKWRLQSVSDGYYELIVEHSGKCLNVTGGPGATQNAIAVQQWTCVGGTNQQWKLVPAR